MSDVKKSLVTQEITFIYEKKDGYNPVYSNGATGGVNPQGELVVHFFCERLSVPIQEKIEIDTATGAVVGGKTSGGGPATLTRSVETGVVMTVESAERIAGWLSDLVKTAKALRSGKV